MPGNAYPEEQQAEAEMKFEPIWYHGKRMYRMLERPVLTYDKFGGLTFATIRKINEKSLKMSRRPSLNRLPWTLLSLWHRFEHGRPRKEITRMSIEDAIRRFRAIGEKTGGRSTRAKKRIASESMKAAFRKMEHNADHIDLID